MEIECIVLEIKAFQERHLAGRLAAHTQFSQLRMKKTSAPAFGLRSRVCALCMLLGRVSQDYFNYLTRVNEKLRLVWINLNILSVSVKIITAHFFWLPLDS